ncbi:MAG: 1-acyl-sn-glycerol-3-phosphate acyltransferase [Candidatus Omnitrophica bacterium]|nr:1-acyl-sn-glycerol-3-phosphate acyltransferase [Candidatus Omnitrophota bacterium]
MTKKRPLLFDLVRSAISWFLVGMVTLILFFPVLALFLALLPFDRTRKNMHPLVSFWAKSILTVCPLMRVHLEGADQLRRNQAYVLVANHQSVADILAVLHLIHPFKFIAKQELFWIPIMGWALFLAGYIPLVRGDQKSGKKTIEKAEAYLIGGVSVLFFPEGTRSRDGEIHDFKVGAFKSASEIGVPVVPIVIYGTRDLIPKGSRLLGRNIDVTVKVLKPRAPFGKDSMSVEQFSKAVRSEIVDALSEVRSRTRRSQLELGLAAS